LLKEDHHEHLTDQQGLYFVYKMMNAIHNGNSCPLGCMWHVLALMCEMLHVESRPVKDVYISVSEIKALLFNRHQVVALGFVSASFREHFFCRTIAAAFALRTFVCGS
jgi:hypothetical protein